MGLLDARTIKKAKGLLEKNRHKVGSIVGKATDQVDKISKGKTSSVTAKIDKAAMKFSHGTAAPQDTGEHTDEEAAEDADVATDESDAHTDDTDDTEAGG